MNDTITTITTTFLKFVILTIIVQNLLYAAAFPLNNNSAKPQNLDDNDNDNNQTSFENMLNLVNKRIEDEKQHNSDNYQNLLVQRTFYLTKIQEKLNNLNLNATFKSAEYIKTTTERNRSVLEDAHTKNTKFICQVFVFGTIFGVVCTISACTWNFSKQDDNDAASNSSSISRLTGTPEPFDSSKPYCLKIDEKGMCYATPLPTGEIPPLPTYDEALKMSLPIAFNFADKKQSDDTTPPTE